MTSRALQIALRSSITNGTPLTRTTPSSSFCQTVASTSPLRRGRTARRRQPRRWTRSRPRRHRHPSRTTAPHQTPPPQATSRSGRASCSAATAAAPSPGRPERSVAAAVPVRRRTRRRPRPPPAWRRGHRRGRGGRHKRWSSPAPGPPGAAKVGMPRGGGAGTAAGGGRARACWRRTRRPGTGGPSTARRGGIVAAAAASGAARGAAAPGARHTAAAGQVRVHTFVTPACAFLVCVLPTDTALGVSDLTRGKQRHDSCRGACERACALGGLLLSSAGRRCAAAQPRGVIGAVQCRAERHGPSPLGAGLPARGALIRRRRQDAPRNIGCAIRELERCSSAKRVREIVRKCDYAAFRGAAFWVPGIGALLPDGAAGKGFAGAHLSAVGLNRAGVCVQPLRSCRGAS